MKEDDNRSEISDTELTPIPSIIYHEKYIKKSWSTVVDELAKKLIYHT
jgi:hypothetical protein